MLSSKYKFSDFVLNLCERNLCKNGEPLKLNNRTFQILCLFVENAEKLVTKDEFFKSIWKDMNVKENNFSLLQSQRSQSYTKGKNNES